MSVGTQILALLGLVAVAASAALLCAGPLIAALDGALKKWRRMGFVPRIVAVLMAAIATVEAQKGKGESSSNEFEFEKGSLSSILPLQLTTPTQISNSQRQMNSNCNQLFRLASVKTNTSYSYAMPASAVRYPNWWMRGGYEDVFKLELGDFSFPIGTNLADYLWVYTWGKVRPGLKAKELEIAAVESPMSAVPQVSEFWYADGTNGSKILTWHNFFVGRIPLSELNGSESDFSRKGRKECVEGEIEENVANPQIGTDLHESICGDKCGFVDCNNGALRTTRPTNEILHVSTRSRMLALPSGSALPNLPSEAKLLRRISRLNNSVVPISLQLELFPNGDYIARSNLVERYFKRVNPDDWDDDGIPNIVDENPNGCDGDFFGPDNDLPEGANSSNYCWVEVAVSNANSLVTFTGDKPSNLPDPYFVAKAGESYAVNLLIGKTYCVTSAQPITCTAKSSDDIIVDQDNERSMTIVYPVSYEIVDNARSVSRQVRLTPPLVGMYTWNTNTCCETEKEDGPYIPSCAPDCTCEGGCDTGGFVFSYEGYSLDFGGVECGCTPNEGDDDEMKPASVEVSFSKSAIIYEEAYETAPGVTVPLRSTESTLSFKAHGGPKGGMVEFVLADGNRLVKGGGSLPYTRELAPGEEVSFTIACTGQGESSGEDDVVVNGIFTENETGEVLATEDRLTVVRVDFIPRWQAYENSCMRRHKVGVREKIGYECIPNLHAVEWINTGNGRFADAEYICSLDSEENPIKVRYKDVDYMPLISVVAPNGIEAASVKHALYEVPTNCAGGIGMIFELRVKPFDVCFSGVAVEEVPCDIGIREGYFAYPMFANLQSHTFNNGAGRWSWVKANNILVNVDEAAIESSIPRITPDGILTNDTSFGWIDGRIVWNIPMGWGEKNSVIGDNPYKKFAEDTKAEMRIFSSGQSGVRKFQHQVTRYIDGRIFLDMREVIP